MTAVARPRGAQSRATEVVRLLREAYPDATCALHHTNAYELLVATILSAQCTDERVNMVTPNVFAKYPTPADLAHADPEEVETLDPVDRVLPLEDEEPDRDGAGGGGAVRRRGARRRSTTS